MKAKEPFQLVPPWGTNPEWCEANHCRDSLIQRYSDSLNSAVSLAFLVRDQLESIFDLLDELCVETCPQCPDPCCLNASPWYDFRDLIYLHLNSLAIPFSQTIHAMNAICCYSSPRGCALARISRPWICTWYLCSVQTANLTFRRFDQWKELKLTINKIKNFRKEMEESFIRVTG